MKICTCKRPRNPGLDAGFVFIHGIGMLGNLFEYIRERSEKSVVLYRIKRAILPLIIASFVVSGLFFSSTFAYFIFYWTYIPSVGIARDVHLQFR